MWDTIIYNYLKGRGIVIPPKEKSDKNEKYAGAYVKEPIPGKSMIGWLVLTLIVSTLTLSCNTTSRQRPYKILDIQLQQPSIRF